MVKRKIYARPLIAEFLLDSELSLVMSSEYTPDPPGGGESDPEPALPTQGTSSFESTTVDDSGIKENPFR
jgi:hypothetical protein